MDCLTVYPHDPARDVYTCTSASSAAAFEGGQKLPLAWTDRVLYWITGDVILSPGSVAMYFSYHSLEVTMISGSPVVRDKNPIAAEIYRAVPKVVGSENSVGYSLKIW